MARSLFQLYTGEDFGIIESDRSSSDEKRPGGMGVPRGRHIRTDCIAFTCEVGVSSRLGSVYFSQKKKNTGTKRNVSKCTQTNGTPSRVRMNHFFTRPRETQVIRHSGLPSLCLTQLSSNSKSSDLSLSLPARARSLLYSVLWCWLMPRHVARGDRPTAIRKPVSPDIFFDLL